MNEDNIYNLEDEDENEIEIGVDTPEKIGESSLFTSIFKILSNPVDGWKNLKRSKFSVEKVAVRIFYPILAIAALSEFMELFYNTDVNFADIIAISIITFITFFFSYFTVLLAGSFLLPEVCRKVLHSNFGKEYVMINITTLALFYFLYKVFPLAGPLIAFLPLLTVYIAYKGIKLFRIPYEKETLSCCIIVGLLIGAPLGWNWIFSDILKII